MKLKKKGGNCKDLLSNIIPLKNISINADINTLISNRNADDLISVLSGSKCSTTVQENPNILESDTTTPADYLYINSRGCYKKMSKHQKEGDQKCEKKGENCGCDKIMNGGCFTCGKSRKKLNGYYNTIVIILPKLYKEYKHYGKKEKMKGGYSSFMDNILNVSSLSFKYKAFEPLNFNAQIVDF
jgi:hypothetical protein